MIVIDRSIDGTYPLLLLLVSRTHLDLAGCLLVSSMKRSGRRRLGGLLSSGRADRQTSTRSTRPTRPNPTQPNPTQPNPTQPDPTRPTNQPPNATRRTRTRTRRSPRSRPRGRRRAPRRRTARSTRCARSRATTTCASGRRSSSSSSRPASPTTRRVVSCPVMPCQSASMLNQCLPSPLLRVTSYTHTHTHTRTHTHTHTTPDGGARADNDDDHDGMTTTCWRRDDGTATSQRRHQFLFEGQQLTAEEKHQQKLNRDILQMARDRGRFEVGRGVEMTTETMAERMTVVWRRQNKRISALDHDESRPPALPLARPRTAQTGRLRHPRRVRGRRARTRRGARARARNGSVSREDLVSEPLRGNRRRARAPRRGARGRAAPALRRGGRTEDGAGGVGGAHAPGDDMVTIHDDV